MVKHTIPASDEAWDERTLGADESFVKAIDEALESAVDDSACTQLISIRMQKSMIEDFKMIAALSGSIGYQTLMKQILHRFVDSEKKRIFRELIAEKLKGRDISEEEDTKPKPKPKSRTRKAA